MNPLNQVTIEEKSTTYRVKLPYHSELMAENYDVKITLVEESDNRISIYPKGGGSFFEFEHSDPDRVIAIAQMMMAAAQMVKDHNAKTVDTVESAC